MPVFPSYATGFGDESVYPTAEQIEKGLPVIGLPGIIYKPFDKIREVLDELKTFGEKKKEKEKTPEPPPPPPPPPPGAGLRYSNRNRRDRLKIYEGRDPVQITYETLDRRDGTRTLEVSRDYIRGISGGNNIGYWDGMNGIYVASDLPSAWKRATRFHEGGHANLRKGPEYEVEVHDWAIEDAKLFGDTEALWVLEKMRENDSSYLGRKAA